MDPNPAAVRAQEGGEAAFFQVQGPDLAPVRIDHQQPPAVHGQVAGAGGRRRRHRGRQPADGHLPEAGRFRHIKASGAGVPGHGQDPLAPGLWIALGRGFRKAGVEDGVAGQVDAQDVPAVAQGHEDMAVPVQGQVPHPARGVRLPGPAQRQLPPGTVQVQGEDPVRAGRAGPGYGVGQPGRRPGHGPLPRRHHRHRHAMLPRVERELPRHRHGHSRPGKGLDALGASDDPAAVQPAQVRILGFTKGILAETDPGGLGWQGLARGKPLQGRHRAGPGRDLDHGQGAGQGQRGQPEHPATGSIPSRHRTLPCAYDPLSRKVSIFY